MAAPLKIEEPCSFQILQLAVTDDINVITSAYDRMYEDNKALENSTVPSKAEKFKRILAAGTELKNDKKRVAIIESHTKAFGKDVVDQFFALAERLVKDPSQRTITDENYESLIMQGQGPTHHLSRELAKKITDDGMRTWRFSLGGRNPLPPPPPSPPSVVTGFVISGAKRYPHLQWNVPAKGCERVRVLAKLDGFPSHDKDGRVVFDGAGTECLDDKAPSARTSYYAIFSHSDGQSSSPMATKEQHFFAVDVEGLKAIPGLEQIEISWQQPTFQYEAIVVFRAPAGSLQIHYGKNQFPSPGNNETVVKRIGKNNRLLESSRAGEIVAGQAYEYMVFVDYGSIHQQREFSAGQSIAAKAVPAAKPVRNLQFRSTKEGLLLSWERPGDLCDKVIVVRAADHFPQNESDGKAITLESENRYLDTDVVAGATYFYAVFSVHQNYASACVTAQKLYAGPARDFTTTDPVKNPGHVGLSWSLPKNVSALKLVRKRGSNPETKEEPGVLKIVSGEEVALPLSLSPTFQDKVDAGVTYHYCLHLRYSDGQWSPPVFTSGKALEPARKVGSVRAVVTAAGDVKLEWAAPDSSKAGIYQYRILRRKKNGDGAQHQIGTSTTASLVDTAKAQDHEPPVPGNWYQYAVQAVVGPVAAAVSEWVEVFITRDVVLNRVIGMRGSVLLEWTPPPNVRHILVRRQADNTVVAADLYRATDTGLSDGVPYSYLVRAVFVDAAGQEFRAPGVTASATPTSPAAPVRNLRVRYDFGVVRVSWELPSSPCDGILVACIETPPVANVGDILPTSVIPSPIPLPRDAVNYEDRFAKIGGICYYAVYTLRGATATFCGSVQAPLLAEVQALTAKNQRNEIWLQWQWPTGVELVRVSRRRASATGEILKESSCTRGQYTARGFFVDKIPPKPGQYVYRVRSVSMAGEQRVESLLFAEVTVVGGTLPEITYKVKRRKSEVEVACLLPEVGPDFGGLDLVWDNARDPLSPASGEVVAQFRPNGKRLSKEVLLRHNLAPGNNYYKVFLAEPAWKLAMVNVSHPPLSERKVEYA